MKYPLRSCFGLHASIHVERTRDPDDKCNFSPSRTNIAIHVRLGDRDGDQGLTTSAQDAATKHARYYDMLEEFMATVSAAVIREGEALPVFHIFSETSEPCPSKDTGAFEEFLRWPVETEQVRIAAKLEHA